MSASTRRADTASQMLTEIIVRDADNIARTITEGFARDDASRQFWGGMSGGGVSPVTAMAKPTSVTGAANTPNLREVSTNATTVTAAGGLAPYTYAWAALEGAMAADSPNEPTTSFSAFIAGGDSTGDTFACTVTDALGQTAQSNNVFASVNNYGKQLNG